MTSINTNVAAVTALRTLQSTNRDLDATQGRISTGLKISEAKDNAAYWAISTTLKSDNKALATVKDALGLGAATVDTAYQGLNSALDVLNDIKSKLTAASQPGVDKDKINAEIVQLKQQLQSIASSSAFSGENWLNDAVGVKSVVSSFTRSSNNAVTLGTIEINASASALYSVTGNTGILDVSGSFAVDNFTTSTAFAVSTPLVFADTTSEVTFTVTPAGGTGTEVKITQAVVNAALGTAAAGTISSAADLSAVLNKALSNSQLSGVTASVNGAGDRLVLTSSTSFAIGTLGSAGTTPPAAADLGIAAGPAAAAAAITGSVDTLAISSSTTKAQIEAYIDMVSAAADKITTQSANLGAVSARIELQQTFVDTLMDTIDKGISGLVDADMNEESTKLQALQVKQQLGVQALSIANQSAQNVLSLFQ